MTITTFYEDTNWLEIGTHENLDLDSNNDLVIDVGGVVNTYDYSDISNLSNDPDLSTRFPLQIYITTDALAKDFWTPLVKIFMDNEPFIQNGSIIYEDNDVKTAAEASGTFAAWQQALNTKGVVGGWSYSVLSAASSSGDPYITTFSGLKYKLPNKYAIYRLLETKIKNKKLIVNASVSKLNDKEIDVLSKTSLKFNINNPITEGYYYENFYIAYDNYYIIFGRNMEIIETNVTSEDNNIFISFDDKIKKFNCPIQGKSVYKSIFLNIFNVKIELQKILHPQILNGINITYKGNLLNVKGIFNTNKHPKNFVIKKLDCHKTISNKLNNAKIYKKIEKENWISVN